MKLSKDITMDQFEKEYWYAIEIKLFAKEIRIQPYLKLRKDELENLIKIYISTGRVQASVRKNITKSSMKDLVAGLSVKLPIHHYSSNKIAKAFIKENALKQNPPLKIKSGAWYRLNRWREDQVTNNTKITYGGLNI